MCGQHTASHALSLCLENGWLNTDDKFQLNRQRVYNLGQIVITTFETERSVALVCNNLHASGKPRKLGLLEAFKSGLVGLVGSGKDDMIAPPPTATQQLGQLNIPPNSSPKHTQMEVGMYTDTTSLEWKEVLQPGQTYGLRFSKSKDEVWAYYTGDYWSPDDVQPAQKLAVDCEDSTIHFTVRDDPAPPKLFARLAMPQECHLTGNTPFTFVIEYSTDSKDPLTIDKSRSPLSVFEGDLKIVEQLIDCRNADTGEEIGWVGFFGCGDSDPHPSFPSDNDFVEILPDKPWRFECTLENLEHDEDSVRSMLGLEPGQTYKAQIAGYLLSKFPRWQYGRKEDLLSGSDEDKKLRWKIDHDKLGRLSVEQIGEPVVFTVVK
ncbi:hypothetical protein EK21DRAFT_58410 [Setomelanomma holmii]|uniref:Uncharacterized protein n=1 Tax=Setomelanomma holmii TaxID=210430 RepID=A0A9P4HFQ7_9PLEO|nr:hypothetical protein EK21DRAFT_58410 [Setomelanomma holmii]